MELACELMWPQKCEKRIIDGNRVMEQCIHITGSDHVNTSTVQYCSRHIFLAIEDNRSSNDIDIDISVVEYAT